MTSEELGNMIHARPFQPFRIHMADGRNVLVGHPDFVARSPSGRTAMVYKDGDVVERIDLRLVTSFEPINGEEA